MAMTSPCQKCGEQISVSPCARQSHLAECGHPGNDPDFCHWLADDTDGSFDTDCGNKFQFFDGTPSENKFRFCPYCGKKIPQA